MSRIESKASVAFFVLILLLVQPLRAEEAPALPQKSNLVGSNVRPLSSSVATEIVEPLPPLPKGPLFLTGTTAEQLTPDYWINRLAKPDRVLKTPKELELFNHEILVMAPKRIDIFSWPFSWRGVDIADQLQLEYSTVENRKLFDARDQTRYVSKDFFTNNVKPLVQLEVLPKQIALKWGVAIRPTSVRALPITVKLLEEVGDIEFDQLQFSLIKLWTPVAIFHKSKDGKWLYVQAPYVRGWVKTEDIAYFSNRGSLHKMVKQDPFLVVLGESVPVFSEPGHSTVFQKPSMGTILPLVGKDEFNYIVSLPARGAGGAVTFRKGYVSRQSDVREGFPPFTQRNAIRQAFKLLGARYGWGGMYSGRDCSGFTHDVFLSMGIDMPRDSNDQSMVGTQLGHFEPRQDAEGKLTTLRSATEGIALLKMPLHQMLYLGEVEGKFFVIHSTWAERVSMTSDEKRRINQVVVSDLSLNGNSYLGSLFDRIISINEIN